jgi:hypothetical protein
MENEKFKLPKSSYKELTKIIKSYGHFNGPAGLVEAAKYLGQVRNAADHGVDIDTDVNDVWHILESTGLQYVFVACSFIRACGARENNEKFYI